MIKSGQDGGDATDNRDGARIAAWLGQPIALWVVIAVLVGVGLAAGIFVAAGGVNVSADRPDGPVVGDLLHFTFKRSEAARSANVSTPADITSPYRVRLAAQHFDMVCSNCHGRPGYGQSVTALSMNPRPQYLPKVIDQFTDPELFEIVQHGVKYSAMPSWPTTARDDEVWSMVAFLRRLPKMDAATYQALTAPPEQANAPTAAAADEPALRPADARRNTPPRDEFLYAAPDWGFSDRSIHDNPTRTCARCHGADGTGGVTGGEAPNLTIQDPAYLQAALQAYTHGSRKSGFMLNIAAQLSSQQIAALSSYYAGLPVKTVASPPADPALIRRGQLIADQGLRERALPACAMCHENAGGKLLGAPHIAGQSATYLRRQLEAMRVGARGSSVGWNPMPAEAHRLDDGDIAAVAAYYSGQKPAKGAAGSGSPQSSPAPATTARLDLGNAKYVFETSCVKCHTNGGRGDKAGGYPDLTLQTEPFLAQSLYAFRARVRPNPRMRYVIDSLTFDQMTSLAHYIGGLQTRPAVLRPDPDGAQRGKVIATRGLPARGVPACLDCHGAEGVAALPLIPRLQGQSQLYLRTRLNNFAKPYNVDLSALDPMPSIAGGLTDQERADLAAYFANATPLPKPPPRP